MLEPPEYQSEALQAPDTTFGLFLRDMINIRKYLDYTKL
jgi:hypothetical protein